MPETGNQISDTVVPLLAKAIAACFAVWALNVLFVAVHELGHAVAATSFGAEVLSIYVSPTGLCGDTCYTQPGSVTARNLVLAGGILATTLATILVSRLKIELAIYVLGLRTIESLFNFADGSDMASLLNWAGPQMYGITFTLTAVTMLCIGRTVYENRLNKKGKAGAI